MANRAAKTAFGPMTIVVADQRTSPAQRLVHDDLAYRFLPAGLRFMMALTRWRPLEDALMQAAEKTALGIRGSMLCRKRYIDDKTLEALRAGNEVVVLLGAGMDTRAYRIPALANVPVFEVDLPENIEHKRTTLRRVLGGVPESVRLVPIDFETQDLATGLAAHGYDIARRTLFVWEGVTQYLTERGVRETFRFLAGAAAGSRLVFTYVRKDFLDGENFYGAENAYQRFKVKEKVWRFGMAPAAVPTLLAEYGWTELEQMGPREFTERYIEPTGRALLVSEIERSVHAEKR
ncbi:SAM-dependent methyltransferase [Sorangium sp. So ce1036]|uniref:SAM-dependent methyltransferase n=1 Tax=Sorangium sp. So ce1036 TaxID=3133328 RepID=UPI003F0DD978